MKKILFAALLLLAGITVKAEPVGKNRAMKVAGNFVKFHFTTAYSSEEPMVTVIDITSEVGAEGIHVFNYHWCPNFYSSLLLTGFVIVSGDDAAAPILAFSTEGELEAENLNPAMLAHLKGYGRQIESAKDNGAKASEAVAIKWEILETPSLWKYLAAKGDMYNDNIPQLLGDMRWGQGQPYNDLCPGNSVTGCVATALGMIMNYWDYPEHGFGSHSYNGADNPAAYPNWTYGVQSADFENTYYDWAHMEDYAYINSPDSVKLAIATLLYHVGVSLDMNYSPDGSGSWSLPEYAIFDTSLHLPPTMGADYRIPRYFGYKYSYAGMRDSVGDDSLWMSMLYTSLAEGKPIYYAGWAVEDNEAGHSGTAGHGYVIDGYFSDEVDSNLFHINWGWSGSANGYFKLDAMRPSNNDFTQWHGAIIGLEPDTTYNGYDPTAIRQIPASTAYVYSHIQHIMVQGAEGQAIAVYDLMGRRVAFRTQQCSSEWSVAVPQGVYIVRVGQAAAQKVVVY